MLKDFGSLDPSATTLFFFLVRSGDVLRTAVLLSMTPFAEFDRPKRGAKRKVKAEKSQQPIQIELSKRQVATFDSNNEHPKA